MEIAANYSARNHASSLKAFDSTDRILDDIDAKLNGVSNTTTHLREADVNEDPGVDVTSIRMFRDHMENQNPGYKSSKIPEFNTIDCKPHDSSKKAKPTNTFHEKRTNLLQLYDDDINLLRRMLQENTDSSTSQNNCEDNTPKNPRERNDVDHLATKKSLLESELIKREELKPPTMQAVQFPPIDETSPCTCGCEKQLEKMTKERDELLARIRRGEASKTSIEERQELERQLHSTKSALFQQRKKSRQQLEDIEEKLDEAQHYYDEKLAEKDEIIATFQEKLASHHQHPATEHHAPPQIPPPPNNAWMKEEMEKKDAEITQLSNLVAKQNQALNDLKAQIKRESNQSISQTNEKVILERKKWQEKMSELELKSEKEKLQYERDRDRLENEKEKLCANVLDLTKKIEEYHREVERTEHEAKEEHLHKENDYKATSELLRSKIERLKEELSIAFASKSELELEFRRQENKHAQESRTKEMELREENKRLQDDLQQVKVEAAQTVAKLKDFKIDVEHQDQSLAASVYDECHKLSALLQNIQSSTKIQRKSFIPKGTLVCKRAVCELQDVVGSVSRVSNDLLCELTRIRREARKKGDFLSMRNNNDVTMASEEAKLLREKLNEKESEVHDMQVNMNQWKDLTAQRLAEKFQEELQLQVERKMSYRSDHVHKVQDKKPEMGRFSKSTNNLANGGGTKQHHGDTSTMKLLCHLQGRVKQLRTENDLLRSSNYIKSIDGR